METENLLNRNPFEDLRIMLALKLSPSAKIILIYFYDKQGQNNTCWPSIGTICDGCGLTRPSVVRAIKELKGSGVVKVIKPKNPSIGHTNHYTVVLTGKESKPVKELNQLRNVTGTGKESLPEPVKNLNSNISLTTNKQPNKRLYSEQGSEVQLSELLLSLILERKSDFKRPDIQKWALHIDRMIRIDKRTPERIEKVIRWAAADSFWQNQILSTANLREKFDRLELLSNSKARKDSLPRIQAENVPGPEDITIEV